MDRGSHGHLSNKFPDELYERVGKQFTEAELINLTLAAVAINGWNRLAIPFRSVPGSYGGSRESCGSFVGFCWLHAPRK